MENAKICKKCGSEKVQVKDASQRLGYAWVCKPCKAIYRREHYQENIETYSEYNRASHQANRARNNAASRKYYQQNPELKKAQALEWSQKNRDARKDIERRHKTNHPERVREAKRKWAAANPEYGQAKCAERRARKRGVVSTLTAAEWREIQLRFDYRCAYCGERKELSKDHVMPLNDFGPHTAQNIVPACISCNSKKHTGPPPVPVQTLLFA